MSNTNEIQPRVRAFILQKFPPARKRGLTDDLLLLESGIIDSLGVLDVVGFLEETFGIKVEDEELTPENFGSVNCMVSFVSQKRSWFDATAV